MSQSDIPAKTSESNLEITEKNSSGSIVFQRDSATIGENLSEGNSSVVPQSVDEENLKVNKSSNLDYSLGKNSEKTFTLKQIC